MSFDPNEFAIKVFDPNAEATPVNNKVVKKQTEVKKPRYDKFAEESKQRRLQKQSDFDNNPLVVSARTVTGLPRATLGVGKDILQGVVGSALKFVQSAALAPTDMARSSMGMDPFEGEIDLPGLPPIRSIQSDFQKDFVKSDSGLESAKAFVDAITETASGAASVLSIAELIKASPQVYQNLSNKGKAFMKSQWDKHVDKKTQKSIDTAVNALEKKLTITNKSATIRENVLNGKNLDDATKEQLRLGESLKDVIKTKNVNKNLKAVGDDMAKTETQLTKVLEADTTPVFKQGLKDSLDDTAKGMPREFQIGSPETKRAFKDVFNFAKQNVDDSAPTIKGLREGRIQFDTVAKKQYPNAYKPSGAIDTKTPAGKAIKLIRDDWNDYLYGTAQEGSLIKELIKREADLFRAIDVLVPKAAMVYGESATTAFLKRIPFFKDIIAHKTGSLITGGIVGGAGYLLGRK